MTVKSDLAEEFPELQNNKLSITITDEDIDQAKDSGNPNPNKIIIPSNIWQDIYESTIPNQPWWDEVEIDVENVNNFDWLQTNLTENGYYEIEEDEETGKLKPVIIPNWQEGDDFGIRINVSPIFDSTTINGNGSYNMIERNDGWKPELVSNPDISQDYDIEVDVVPTFDSTTINGNGSYNMVEGNNGWKPELVSNPDPSKTYDLKIQVPQTINLLETITNKRLQSETTYTISSLMNDPTNNAGITKNSTLIVDVPDPVYPTITFNTITNNNSTYTLSQLTNNQSDYFDKDSIINISVSTTFIYYRSKFKYSRSDDVLHTPSWSHATSNTTISLGAKRVCYIFRNENNTFKLLETLSDDENTGATVNVISGDYYFLFSTNQTTERINVKLWYDGNLFKETYYIEADTTNGEWIYNYINYLNSRFSSS